MSKYFEKYNNVKYYDYLKGIMEELGRYGYFKGSIETLDNLWRIFSEECYCASFLFPCKKLVSEFVNWLDNYEEDI